MCEDCYQGFAKEFPLRYSESIVNTFMGVLTASRNGAYLSPRVLHKILSYLKNAYARPVSRASVFFFLSRSFSLT